MDAHGTVTSRLRDIRVIAGILVLVIGMVTVGIIASVKNGQAQAQSGAGEAPTVSCPSVIDQLPEIPAAAAGDVERELSALQTQINEANNRLVTSQGQGGPAFIDNAVLGPLADKRVATLERIEIAIGRHGDRPDGLVALATCALATDGAGEPGGGEPGGGDDNGEGGAAPPPPPPAAPEPPPAPPAPPAAGATTVNCPGVVDQLSEVPDAAADDVAKELTALENQIEEANNRLVSSQGEGGPAFIDNAILGPLADKRVATLERIEIAIGRHGDRPTGLVALAECTLN